MATVITCGFGTVPMEARFMRSHTEVIGLMEKSMGKESAFGMIVPHTTASTKMIRKMAMVFTNGKMVTDMRASGRTGTSMDMVC